MSDEKRTGHCYCGAIEFETRGEPLWVAHCHCESCRRHSGSVMNNFAGFRPAQVNWLADRPAHFKPGNGVTRSFCSRCGSPIAYESVDCPDEIHLYLGLFDDLEQLRPRNHSFYQEKVSWLQADEQLPKSAPKD